MTEQTRQAVDEYLTANGKKSVQLMFSGRLGANRSMTTRQYARLVSEWIAGIGLDPHVFRTHSLRRTKATLIYRRTGNHKKIESTIRYLGIEVDDALASRAGRRVRLRQSMNALPGTPARESSQL